jgi:hypothetical protein
MRGSMTYAAEVIPICSTKYVIAPGYTGFDRRKSQSAVTIDNRNSNGHEGVGELGIAEHPDEAGLAPDTAESIRRIMFVAGARFRQAVDGLDTIEPETDHERRTTINVEKIIDPLGEAHPLSGAWRPFASYEYTSKDPYQEHNPELTFAMTQLIHTVMDIASVVRHSNDPTLTYLGNQRSRGGKKPTVLTAALMDIDPGIADWTSHLPDAERLRPVAGPWSDITTITTYDGLTFQEQRMTKALQALMGGSGDGVGVRERQAWQRHVLGYLKDMLTPQIEKSQALVITSLGTGTGEPIMDTGTSLIEDLYGSAGFSTIVNGFDVNPRSLAVAGYIARQKRAHREGKLTFRGATANLLSSEGIELSVGSTKAHVYEAIGFAEYVPSDNAQTIQEKEQRRLMQKAGFLSAEEFYAAIYQNMPVGSVLLTGNMRDDSPQANFVIQGLGWKGIIQRSTEEYLGILENAGIPDQAVRLYLPKKLGSSGVYNLVAITKQ